MSLFSLVSLLVTQSSVCCTGSLTPPGWHIHTRCYRKVCRVSRIRRMVNTRRRAITQREMDRTVKRVSVQQLNWYRLLIIVRRNRRSPIKWPPLDYSRACSWPNCHNLDKLVPPPAKPFPSCRVAIYTKAGEIDSRWFLLPDWTDWCPWSLLDR